MTVEIAGHRAAHGPDPLVPQPEHLARLRLRRYAQLRLTIERRNLDLATERGSREAHRHFAMQIGAVAREDRMCLEIDDHVEVARRTAVRAGFALARQADPIVLVDAGGNLHRERLVLLDASCTLARRAWLGNHLARSATLRTRLLNREETLRHTHFAAALACRARLRLRAGLRAAAVTRFAFLERRNADLDLGTARRVFQRKLEVVSQVGAAVHAIAAPAALLPEDL